MNELNQSLIDIGRGIIPQTLPAPTPTELGGYGDFDVTDHGSIFVLEPISDAALQWCYTHLPEECDRWGKVGFVIGHRYIADVVAGMERDSLISVEDYKNSMEELNAIAHQWEEQE